MIMRRAVLMVVLIGAFAFAAAPPMGGGGPTGASGGSPVPTYSLPSDHPALWPDAYWEAICGVCAEHSLRQPDFIAIHAAAQALKAAIAAENGWLENEYSKAARHYQAGLVSFEQMMAWMELALWVHGLGIDAALNAYEAFLMSEDYCMPCPTVVPPDGGQRCGEGHGPGGGGGGEGIGGGGTGSTPPSP